ncbi:MAG: dTDP-4-dehydrorhamnose reductase [Candidatus Desulforudis sp.]|nr:dTDP-4-dehydrorhamnose reductase [Desulforudis sp.]
MTKNAWPKIMLIGKNGQIGWELHRTLATLGQVAAYGRAELDLTNIGEIRECVRALRPNVIVNAAAYTAVDKAEEEPELAMAVNGIAPGILAEEAKIVGAVLVHYSTDYVFDGDKVTPYGEEDQPNPVNVYGKTKLEGERFIQSTDVPHLILRTSWVYGLRGNNFLLTITRLSKHRNEIRVVNDQVGSPTWSRLVAEATAQILANGRNIIAGNQGIYHASATGQTTWFGFAQEIIGNVSSDCNPRMVPISTEEYGMLAERPAYSVLNNGKLSKAFGLVIPEWKNGVALALDIVKVL